MYHHHAAGGFDWIIGAVLHSAIWSTTSRLLRSLTLTKAIVVTVILCCGVVAWQRRSR